EKEVAAPAVAQAKEIVAPVAAEKPIAISSASYLQEVHLSDEPEPVAEPVAVSAQEPAAPAAASAQAVAAEIKKPEGIEKFADEDFLRKEPASMPQSKTVRIALERLDRMMNAVGELVINRTRMLGRVAELERLADVLNFSKARMSDKVSEFTEKHEFSQLSTMLPKPRAEKGISFESPYRGGYSSYSHSYDSSLAE